MNGKVAVYGLLETAGVSNDSDVGNSVLMLLQKLGRFFNGTAQTFLRSLRCVLIHEIISAHAILVHGPLVIHLPSMQPTSEDRAAVNR